MLSRWRIRYKLIIGFSLLVVVVATLSGSGLWGLYSFRGLAKGLSWRVEELPLAENLDRRVGRLRLLVAEMRGLRELQDAAPGRLDTQTRLHRARLRFNEGLAAVAAALQQYRDQLDNEFRDDFRIADNHLERQTVRQIEVALSRARQAAGSDAGPLMTVELDRLAGELGELQRLTTELPGYLYHKFGNFAGEVKLQYRTLIVGAWIASVLAAVLFVLSTKLFVDWVFRPLRTIIHGSRRVAAGQFDYRIHLSSQDEMRELAEALNDMTSRFQTIRADLDRQVRERTRQVIRNEQLASVGLLAAGVAHEINNPLASVAMCAESLQARVSRLLAEDDPQQEVVCHYLRMIQSEAFRCKEITGKLLDFSRTGEVKRQDCNLREIVEGVIEMLGHLGRYRRKQIELVSGGPVIVSVNAQEIKQVVLNLVTNALDSIKEHGRVSIEIRAGRGSAEMVVRDDGCGMDAEVLEHLFEPFFTRRRSGQGTGLGLSITYRIVHDHGGEIEASSPGPGKGSTFCVRLPLAGAGKEVKHRYQQVA